MQPAHLEHSEGKFFDVSIFSEIIFYLKATLGKKIPLRKFFLPKTLQKF